MNRPVPVPTADDAGFWRGGAEGTLLVHRCHTCHRWFHPPAPVCSRCYSRDVAPEATSGRGEVWAHTVNHQPWFPGMPPPYVVAIVELVEQPGLRLTTNIVGCAPDAVRAGLAVEVCFEQVDADVWLPLFRPVDA
jgi:uncharacterized OB-fold protein